LITDSPYALLGSGRWAKRPFIAGSTKDEGTLFASTSANETTLRASIRGGGFYQRSDETIERLLELYPEDPAQGS
jgi:carboxylesterase type B